MEEGNKLVEQSDTVEAQGEASAPWSVEGSTVPIPPVQITTQVAQQMATFFQ